MWPNSVFSFPALIFHVFPYLEIIKRAHWMFQPLTIRGIQCPNSEILCFTCWPTLTPVFASRASVHSCSRILFIVLGDHVQPLPVTVAAEALHQCLARPGPDSGYQLGASTDFHMVTENQHQLSQRQLPWPCLQGLCLTQVPTSGPVLVSWALATVGGGHLKS